jgi:serine phosphatase RsbU (regulator of sigma subunit)
MAALVNRFLCTRNVGKYATMVILKLFADGRLEYLNCGHIKPLAVLGSEVRSLAESNLVVGLIESAVYRSGFERLQPGERLLLATDGITEAENPLGEPFGDASLSTLWHSDDLDAVLEEVASFRASEPAQDDCTLVQVRYEGEQ